MYKLLPRISTSSDDLPFNEDPSPNQQSQSQFLHEAIFAGGSFWALEAAYGNIDGVVKTSTGYFGGTLTKPSYKQVCEGGTGHTEAVKVVYDIRKISFTSLCDLFWDIHDPTNKEFLNFGLSTHQRSAIFYTKEGERKEAQESKIRRQMRMNKRIVTKILAVGNSEFFLAENQHQKYYLQKYHRLCGSLELRSTHQFVESTIACKLNGYFITLNFHQLQFTNYLSDCFLALLYSSFWSIFF
uniref:peptide-methionine (S)-S-oxide reductase n=1 Tax=Opuntia streptacantha TaxID=393608 RepID=A0A7C8ZHY9_OPUST